MGETYPEIRASVRALCARFDRRYWRDLDGTDNLPESFLKAFTESGFTGALVPREYGGSGLGTQEAAAILEEVHASGADGGICHAAMNVMSALANHGSHAQKARWLPKVANGELRFLAFAVTEAEAGTDTSRIRTTATREGDRYRVRGRKIWISRAIETDLMLVLVRTAGREDVARRTDGLSVLLVETQEALGNGLTATRIPTMVNHNSTELLFEDLRVPVENLVGPEGGGFRCIMDGMNAERILIAAECVGDARWFVETASAYARDREVFGRPIGQNQGVQFPIAEAHVRTFGARLAVEQAAKLYDEGQPCGAEANMAKYLASDASWRAGDTCLQVHGGLGFAAEADVERKFRESRLYAVAPLANNLVLSHVAERVLGLPRSF